MSCDYVRNYGLSLPLRTSWEVGQKARLGSREDKWRTTGAMTAGSFTGYDDEVGGWAFFRAVLS
jgi:hypothetical protein